MREIEVKIEKLAFGGAGFGHLCGKACFVPFTAPGDLVRARVTREKGSYLEAELFELLVPSPDRTTPRCPVFGQCGGCSLQHLPYAKQLTIKEELFAEQLRRFARVDRDRISPIQGAENPWGYRTRVQVKVHWIGGRLNIGFYRAGTHYIVPFPGGCAIAGPVINKLICELTLLLPDFSEPAKIPQVDLAVGDNGLAVMIVHYIGQSPDRLVRFLAERASIGLPSATGLWIQHGRKNSMRRILGIDRLTYGVSVGRSTDSAPELRLAFSRGGFSQVNYLQNRNLVTLVSEFAQLNGTERLLDIFCGNGNITIPLAGLAREVVGMEEYGPSVDDARQNALNSGLTRISFICADAVAGVKRLIQEGEQFDVVLLDPPRSGASELMRYIPALRPERVVYVSCDPVTLARDIAILRKLDYCMVRSVPLDMFPQTCHIESVTLLERC